MARTEYDYQFGHHDAILDRKLDQHLSSFNNPHRVTKVQVGLGKVENISPVDMPLSNETKEYVDKFIKSLKIEQNVEKGIIYISALDGLGQVISKDKVITVGAEGIIAQYDSDGNEIAATYSSRISFEADSQGNIFACLYNNRNELISESKLTVGIKSGKLIKEDNKYYIELTNVDNTSVTFDVSEIYSDVISNIDVKLLEIDSRIKTIEEDYLTSSDKSAIESELSNLDNSISSEKNRAEEKEKDLLDSIQAEALRASSKEETLENKINDIEENSHSHANKNLLDSIEENNLTSLSEKTKLAGIQEGATKTIASATGTSEEVIKYININGVEYKIYGGETTTVTESENNGNVKVNGSDVLVYTLPDAYKKYLDEVTFEKPTITNFDIIDNLGNSISGTYELGTKLTAVKLSHKENNIDNISGNLYLGSISVTPVNELTTVDLPTPEDITATKTYTISGKDTRGSSISKSITANFKRYSYSILTESEEAPDSGLIKGSEENAFYTDGKLFTYEENQYLYMYVTSEDKKVQTNVLHEWIDVTFKNMGQVEILQSNGVKHLYYAYRVGPFNEGSSATYRVK